MSDLEVSDAYSGRARAAVAVTALTLSVHGATFVIQVLIAHYFGAGSDVDAFLAATAVPHYLVTVLLGTVPAVLIPVFASYASRGATEDAWRTVRGSALMIATTMLVVAIVGIMGAGWILRAAAPGLDPSATATGVVLSWIVWPGVFAAALNTLLTAVNQAERRFAWSSAVPAIGAVINVLLLTVLAHTAGIYAAAVGMTVASVVQAALLAPTLFRVRIPMPRPPWRHEGVRQVFVLLWPLLLSGFLIRVNLVIERHLASHFEPGSIAHITYASRIAALLAVICSTGISTVLFPSFAGYAASGAHDSLRRSMSRAMRLMWLFAAPCIAIGAPLASPVIAVALEHGRFAPADTDATAALLRIYLWSLVAGSLGMVTSRALYAMKATRLIAGVGAVEALLYVAYTFVLSRTLGLAGVAWGFVIYASLSFAWQMVFIDRRIGWHGTGLPRSLSLTALCATFGAVAAHLICRTFMTPLSQVGAGISVGLLVYGALLFALNRMDVTLLLQSVGVWRTGDGVGRSR